MKWAIFEFRDGDWKFLTTQATGATPREAVIDGLARLGRSPDADVSYLAFATAHARRVVWEDAPSLVERPL